jgi:hypothetical protein
VDIVVPRSVMNKDMDSAIAFINRDDAKAKVSVTPTPEIDFNIDNAVELDGDLYCGMLKSVR